VDRTFLQGGKMNATIDRRVDRPVERDAGVSIRRERLWGLSGGLAGAVFGLGSALIAVYIEGASWWSSSTPYPQFFAHHRLLTYDYFLVSALLVGALFQVGALWTARAGRYPRTDSFGGTLVGMILMLLAGVLLFARLVAIAHAR
jgi:hypothetical protein